MEQRGIKICDLITTLKNLCINTPEYKDTIIYGFEVTEDNKLCLLTNDKAKEKL